MVTYVPHLVEVAEIEAKIRGLGYTPHQVDELESVAQGEAGRGAELPAPVDQAALAAIASSKLIFVDFYAAWCGPCKVLEKKVLSAPAVERALEDFEFVKLDTDKYPAAAEYFQILALPTLVVLDANGAERYRHVGPISIEELLEALAHTGRPNQNNGTQ